MIQTGTNLFISDNSGGKLAICIKVLKKKYYAFIGDLIKVSIKKLNHFSKVKKGDIYFSIIIRSVKGLRRKDGTFIKFNDNSIVLLNSKFELLGTRVFGPVPKEVKNSFCPKIISLSSEIV